MWFFHVCDRIVNSNDRKTCDVTDDFTAIRLSEVITKNIRKVFVYNYKAECFEFRLQSNSGNGSNRHSTFRL